PAPRPQGAHNRVLTALPKGPALPLPTHTALPGGNAAVGRPIGQQNAGNVVVNPPVPVRKEPPPEPAKPAPAPEPAPPAPRPAPAPVPRVEAPPAPEPERPAPKPRGPSRDAEPANTVKPDIPDDLKREQFRSFVRVRVEVEPDGSFTAILRTSSGNPEIDR